jgi:acetamidase/formamidase
VTARPSAATPAAPCNYRGNLDCRDVVKGNTMFYPVAHTGVLLYLGDLQATQATEFGGTAVETTVSSEVATTSRAGP